MHIRYCEEGLPFIESEGIFSKSTAQRCGRNINADKQDIRLWEKH
jgi:hypothetical protein